MYNFIICFSYHRMTERDGFGPCMIFYGLYNYVKKRFVLNKRV